MEVVDEEPDMELVPGVTGMVVEVEVVVVMIMVATGAVVTIAVELDTLVKL